jgi:hypothetical protein
MGMDCFGNGGFSVNWAGWERLLEVARANGWEPAGTIPMDERDWNRPDENTFTGERAGYYSNDSQLVTKSDAAEIANSLRRALSDSGQSFDAIEQQWIENFAAYCAKGGFRLH